jgi:hypothetical protein
MKTYKNESGVSGIDAYEIFNDGIKIRFTDGDLYNYTYKSCGRTNVEKMKKLAQSGLGLATFINRNVKNKYEK